MKQPPEPGKMFSASVVAADFNDPTPNFCYEKNECYFAGFANSKSWGEQGKQGYGTSDLAQVPARRAAAKKAKTMGELAVALREQGLLYIEMKDFLDIDKGTDATFCMYAHTNTGKQQAGTLVSNCSDAPVAPVSCKLTPEAVLFDWGTVTPKIANTRQLKKNVTLKCTKPTNIRLYISGDYISLNGNQDTRAEFNFGNGWTGKTEVYVENDISVEMNSRLVGFEDKNGDFSGSSVLVMEQI
ncbi:hypothetical protein ACX43S_25350 [Enterobacter cloacae]